MALVPRLSEAGVVSTLPLLFHHGSPLHSILLGHAHEGIDIDRAAPPTGDLCQLTTQLRLQGVLQGGRTGGAAQGGRLLVE